MEIQIKDNKIFAPLKNKWLVYKPEEEVRQKYICRLVDSYGYSFDQMAQELQVTNSHRGQGAARADIVIWCNKEDKQNSKNALIVVECKAESVTIHQEDYFQGNNYAVYAGADFFVTTNLKETRILRVVKGEIPKRLEEIADIPDAAKATSQKEIDKLLKQTKAFTRDEFSKLLFKCHNIIRNNDKLSPEAAFDEISKILFIKIRYERSNDDGQIKPGGRMGIVLPEGVLNNTNLQKIRDFVESKAKILLIVYIPQDVFIAHGSTVKPSLLFFKKFTEDEAAQYDKIVENAQKEAEGPYQSELNEIAEKLSKRGKEAMSKEEKKHIKDRQKEIIAAIDADKKKIVKERFDYQISIAEVQKDGISTTGAPIENELEPLEQEYTAYRKEQTLWKSTFQSVHYALDSDGKIIRMCDTKKQ